MTSRSYIRVPRTFWTEPPYDAFPHSDHRMALLWLAEYANYAEGASYNPPLQRGELFRSYAQLARAWGVERRRAVTILDWLRSAGHVRTTTMRRGEEHRGCKLVGSGMVIEVVDLDTFNPPPRAASNGTPNGTPDRTPNGTQADGKRYTDAPENPSTDEGVTERAERQRYTNGTDAGHPTVQQTGHPTGPTIDEGFPVDESSPVDETHPSLPPVGTRAGGSDGRTDDVVAGGSLWRRGYSVEVAERLVRDVVAGGPEVSISFHRPPGAVVTESLDAEGFDYLSDTRVWVAPSTPDRVRLLSDIATTEVLPPAPRASGWSTAPELPPVLHLEDGADNEEALRAAVAQLPPLLADDVEWANVRWVVKGDEVARLATSDRHAAARLARQSALEVLGDVLSDQHGGCWRVELDYVEPGKVVRLADRRAR